MVLAFVARRRREIFQFYASRTRFSLKPRLLEVQTKTIPGRGVFLKGDDIKSKTEDLFSGNHFSRRKTARRTQKKKFRKKSNFFRPEKFLRRNIFSGISKFL